MNSDKKPILLIGDAQETNLSVDICVSDRFAERLIFGPPRATPELAALD